MKTIIASFALAMVSLALSAHAEGLVRPVDGSAKLQAFLECASASSGDGEALQVIEKPASSVEYIKLPAGRVFKTKAAHADFTIGTLDNEAFAKRVTSCDARVRGTE